MYGSSLLCDVLRRDVRVRELVVHAGARARDVGDAPPPPLPEVVARQALLQGKTIEIQ